MTQVSLAERSIELSNLDDIYDMSRQGLIWEGLGEIECHFNPEIGIKIWSKLFFSYNKSSSTLSIDLKGVYTIRKIGDG